MQQSGNTLLYREGELVIMSSTLLAPMEVEYVGHIDVSPEEEEKSRQEFLRILEKYFPASSLYGKSTRKQSKTPKLNADAEE